MDGKYANLRIPWDSLIEDHCAAVGQPRARRHWHVSGKKLLGSALVANGQATAMQPEQLLKRHPVIMSAFPLGSVPTSHVDFNDCPLLIARRAGWPAMSGMLWAMTSGSGHCVNYFTF